MRAITITFNGQPFLIHYFAKKGTIPIDRRAKQTSYDFCYGSHVPIVSYCKIRNKKQNKNGICLVRHEQWNDVNNTQRTQVVRNCSGITNTVTSPPQQLLAIEFLMCFLFFIIAFHVLGYIVVIVLSAWQLSRRI